MLQINLNLTVEDVNIEITKKNAAVAEDAEEKNHLVIEMVVVLEDVEVQKNHLEIEEVKTTIRIEALADVAVIDQTGTLTMTESHLASEEKEEKEDNFIKNLIRILMRFFCANLILFTMKLNFSIPASL